jgi:hypothetical protein
MRTGHSSHERERAAQTVRAGGHTAQPRAKPGAHAIRQRIASRVVVAFVVAPLLLGAWLAFSTVASGPSEPATSAPQRAAATVGVDTHVHIGDAGGLFVVETLTFGASQDRLDLSVPRLSGPGEALRPTITRLTVREPAASTAPTTLTSDQGTVRVDLSTPAKRVVLEFAAGGVAQRSGDRSVPGRALALVTPLDVAQAEGLPATVRVESVKVLNVGCARAGVLTGCGTRTSDGWIVETTADGPPATVFAQLNLTAP